MESDVRPCGRNRITLGHCWVHVRRKHVEAAPSYPKAKEMIDKIGILYVIEARADDAGMGLEESGGGPSRARSPRRSIRGSRRSPRCRGLFWERRSATRSGFGRDWRASSMDARLPLDTNRVERGMRGPAVGRKNHYGSRSMRGTKIAALLCSLVETAKLAGIEPRRYLREATCRAIASPGTATLPRDLLIDCLHRASPA